MRTAVVTSCSRAGFEKYGLRCLTTLNQFWPADIDVYLVSEDSIEVPSGLMDGRKFRFINLSESQYAARFYAENDTHRARGMVGRYYDFKFDAWKFSKKVFAVELVAARSDVERLVWLDADVFTYTPIPVGFFDKLPPHAHALACLERPGYHSECGFVGYNLANIAARKFITEFAQLYVTGDVFRLKEWHDSFVFDWLRKKMVIPTYKIPHKSRSHPFIHSVLGKFMDHLKGVHRKNRGQSDDHPRLGVSRVLQTRKPLVHKRTPKPKLKRALQLSPAARWAAKKARWVTKQREKVKRLQEEGHAMRNGDLVAGWGHPLPGDALQIKAGGWEGHLPVEQVDGGVIEHPTESTKLSS